MSRNSRCNPVVVVRLTAYSLMMTGQMKGGKMKSERIYIRIKPEDKAKLQVVANDKRRTVTSLIDEMIEKLLEEEMTTKTADHQRNGSK